MLKEKIKMKYYTATVGGHGLNICCNKDISVCQDY